MAEADRACLVAAGVNGSVAVACAALGAHALPAELPQRLAAAYATGAEMHLVHAAALLALAFQGGRYRIPFWMMLSGAVLFSGALYAFAFSGSRIFAHAAPLGGLTLMLSWLAVAAAAIRRP